MQQQQQQQGVSVAVNTTNAATGNISPWSDIGNWFVFVWFFGWMDLVWLL